MKVIRCENNPLISPANVKPSREDFRVDGIFNCGVAKYGDEIILLCRVAESVACDPSEVKIPIVVKDNRIEIVTLVKKEHPEMDFGDSRAVRMDGKTIYLTSLSHLRIARSRDGINFHVEDAPFVFPNAEEESWGMEDPRITQIEDTYYINYTSVTPHGAATSLLMTKDFKTCIRKGVIFAPENKDVAIFPEKINGKYIAFNRPVPCGIGNPDIWIAESPDLIHWGNQKYFCGISEESSWENGRIGGGAVPFKTSKGWVKIYHGADKDGRYCLGAFLLDLNDPSKVLAKTREPVLQPETDYEKYGFFNNVVFTCGCILEDDNVIIYYGAADDKICRADIKLCDLLEELHT